MARNDILLRAGVTFSPRDVDARAVRQAVVRSLATTRVQINRVTLGRDARTSLQESIRRLRIRVDSATIGRAGQTSLKTNFSNIAFRINNATFSAQAIRQLQAQLSQVNATIRPQPGVAGGPIGQVDPQSAGRIRELEGRLARLQNQVRATNDQFSRFNRGAAGAAVATRQLSAATNSTNTGLAGFGNNIAKITARFSAYLISLRLILGVQQAFNASLEVIFRFDSAIQDLAKVLNDLDRTLPVASQGILDLAANTGAAFDEISASVGTFVRAGLEIEEALSRAEVAIRATQVSELALNEATKVITTSLQVFGDEVRDAGEALDVISFISDRAATSADEVARAIIRSGAAAEATGVGFRQLVGIIAATTETTQQSASTIGAALKTIFASLAGNEQQLRAVAESLGVNIEVGASLFQILKSLSEVSDQFTRSQIAQLTALVGGKRRFTEFNALLSSFAKAEQLAEDSANAAGTAISKQEAELAKLENIVSRTQAELSKFVIQLTGAEEGAEATGGIRQGFAQILEGVTSVVGVLNTGIQQLKEFDAVASVLGGVFSSLVKVGFLRLGPKIIAEIIRGIRNFAKETTNVASSLKVVATAQNNVTNQVNRTNESYVRTNQNLREQASQLRRIVDLNRLAARQAQSTATSTSSATRQGLFGRARAGANALGGRGGGGLRGLALVAALDTLAGQMSELGNRTAEVAQLFGGDLEQGTESFLNNLGQMSGSAIQTATTFGLLLGPVAGVTAGILSFSSAIVQGSIELRRATLDSAESIQNLAARTLTAEQAIERFGEAGRQAVEELGGVTGVASEAVVLERVLNEIANGGLNLERSIRTMNDAFGDAVSAFEVAESRLRVERRVAADRRRNQDAAGGFDLRADAAGTSREFERILDAQVKANSELSKFVSNNEQAASSLQIINGLQTAIAAKNADLVRLSADALSNVGLTTRELQIQESAVSEARTRYQEAELSTQDLARQVELVNTNIGESVSLLESQLATDRILLTQLQSRGEAAETIAAVNQRISDTEDEIARKQAIINSANEDLTELKSAQEKFAAALSNEESKQRDLLREVNEELETSLATRQQEADVLNVISSQVRANAANIRAEVEFQSSRLRIRQAQIQEELRGGSIAQRNQQRLNALEDSLFEKVDRVADARSRELRLIDERIQKLRSNDADDALADQLERNLPEFRRAIEEERRALEQEAQLKFQLELLEINAENIRRAEDSLLQFRLNRLDQIRRKEDEVSQRRIAAIERLGETQAGRQLIQEDISPQPGLVREFGVVQAALIEETVRATRNAVDGMLVELDELRTGGRFSAEQLTSAQQDLLSLQSEIASARRRGDEDAIASAETAADAVKAQIAEMLGSGQQAFENLTTAQRNAGEILELQEQRNSVRREAALKNAEDAADAVNNAEKNLVSERNKIPALNAKIIEAQKNLASANAEVEEATKSLVQANQELADANFQLQFDINLAAVKARQAAGAFRGPQEQIGALASAFRNAVGDIRASGQAILEARRAVLQEELSIVQNQLQSIRSLALEAATASPDDLAQLQEGIATAFEVAAGRADLSSVDPEILGSLTKFTDVVPGLEDALLRFGAERLGIDPSTFQTFEQQLVELQTGIAETGQTQVDAAERGVAAAQAQLEEARQQRETAESALDVAVEQKDVQLSIAGRAARQVAISRVGFAEQRRLTDRQLKLFAAGAIVDKDIQAALTATQQLEKESLAEIKAFKESSEASLAAIESVDLSTSEAAANTDALLPPANRTATATEQTASNTAGLIQAINDINVRISNASAASIPENFSGSLTNSEINGLLAAAKREKRGMPAGAQLMLANTSETVLTRKQSKKVGLAYKGHIPNAQEGFGVISDLTAISSLNDRIGSLETSIRGLANNVNAQGPVQVQVDSSRQVTVNGLQELPQAVQRAVEDRIGQAPSQEEVTAIRDSVSNVLNRLRENGLEDFN